MIINERDSRTSHLEGVAQQIMTAGRTAPKAKGFDNVEIVAITGDDIKRLAEAVKQGAEESGMMFFLRDAQNVLSSEAVILVGSRANTMGLNCAYCGFDSCAKKESKATATPCVMNSVDTGIALGAMCAMAADLRVDSRVMFSAGSVARKIGVLTDCQSVFALPISASSKSPYFDRPTSK